MKQDYTSEQKNFINYISKKVRNLFLNYPEPAHGIDHIERVVNWAKEIAKKENARSIFLCELSAWLHDIGRTREDNPGENTRKHHELSYEMLREWFREDENFAILNDEEKKELLYAVRYHWNNAADDYDTAWILRDADKLDIFGKQGLDRAWKFMKDNDALWNQHLRNMSDYFAYVHTDTAKKIIKDNNFQTMSKEVYRDYLKSKIKPVEL
ncbi:MAG: HD domain-containing protein [Patescibacteria group bacterium]|jgi:HD superfamily phosphodiesterase|nr:HD domain-containing protein [Candidatus Magasanikbacteria bacterium]HQL52470.1 HD domain-containing protein [Candidatus Magasanikbacteria bacterium]